MLTVRKKSLRSFSWLFAASQNCMGLCPIPRRLLKKAGENFTFALFCKIHTLFRILWYTVQNIISAQVRRTEGGVS